MAENSENKDCDLIRNAAGWWLQHVDQKGQTCSHLLKATTEADAMSEAHNYGYNWFHVWIEGKKVKDVKIPKGGYP